MKFKASQTKRKAWGAKYEAPPKPVPAPLTIPSTTIDTFELCRVLPISVVRHQNIFFDICHVPEKSTFNALLQATINDLNIAI